MSARLNRRNNKRSQKENKEEKSLFNMDIKDDFYEPFNETNDDFGLNHMFNTFDNLFNFRRLPQKKEQQNNEENKKENNKENNNNNNNGTYISQTYCCSYNNINGKENNECYQSMCHKEIKDGHDISETKELYKNSNGVNKTAYQRNLDNKKARFIKEKNTTNGKENQKRIVKGMADDDLKNFNKEFNQCAKTLGFNKGLHSLLGNKRENKYMNRLLLH